MFEFFKRLVSPEAPAQRSRSPAGPQPAKTSKSKARDASLAPPAPLPEVVEGNAETDWALWEDSMTALDSQKQPLGSRASHFDNLPSSQSGDLDAFSSVRKRDR